MVITGKERENVERGLRRWDARNLEGMIPTGLVHGFLENYSDRQIDFIMTHLKFKEIRAVKEIGDYLPAAILSTVGDNKLKVLEKRFRKVNFRHYLSVQREWMQDERYYVGERLRHEVTDEELLEDFETNNFGLRFSCLYILRHIKDRTKIVHMQA